ncbi:unnamed protein product [Allacma fusca]|uniref:Uncharacterized protein n=1 Tax=Allacma fusca TaxID=39272 RepID=A0A8J2KW93_9HEXA|nr:unnamed protein product [Allacma fusca]
MTWGKKYMDFDFTSKFLGRNFMPQIVWGQTPNVKLQLHFTCPSLTFARYIVRGSRARVFQSNHVCTHAHSQSALPHIVLKLKNLKFVSGTICLFVHPALHGQIYSHHHHSIGTFVLDPHKPRKSICSFPILEAPVSSISLIADDKVEN